MNWLSTTGDPSSLGDKYAIAWGVGPLITWRFPNLAASRAQLAQARADNTAARASFDAQVLRALKETEQALARYGAEWRRKAALDTARAEHARAYRLAELNYDAGALDFSACSTRSAASSRSMPHWPRRRSRSRSIRWPSSRHWGGWQP